MFKKISVKGLVSLLLIAIMMAAQVFSTAALSSDNGNAPISFKTEVVSIGDDYTIRGLSENTTVEFFLNLIANPANVSIKNAKGESKTKGLVCTGDIVEVATNGRVTASFVIIIKGDVNGDGKASATDYLLVKRYVLGTFKLAGDGLKAADINTDGKVQATDYLLLKRYVLGTFRIYDRIVIDESEKPEEPSKSEPSEPSEQPGTETSEPSVPHTHSYKVTSTTAATCNKTGSKVYTCSCGDSYAETVPATGHSYSSKVTKQPGCETTGVRTYTCSACGNSYTESINATGHDWKTETVHHDAVTGTRDITETWVHATGYIYFILTNKGIAAGLDNRNEFPGWEKYAPGHIVKVFEIWYKEGEIDSTVEWVFKYNYNYNGEFDKYLGKPGYSNKVSCETIWLAEKVLEDFDISYRFAYSSYNNSQINTNETRVVGTETYVITPAYDETITTCTHCGKQK